MPWILLLNVALVAPLGADRPSHGELVQAVVAEREKVRTLQVEVFARRELPEVRSSFRTLYLDVDGRRWRFDSTGFMAGKEAWELEGEGVFTRKVSVNGDFLFTFFPGIGQGIARRDYFADAIARGEVNPFPDPRNAGLTAAYSGNMGTPFELAGTRVSLYTYDIECIEADRIGVETAIWDGKAAWAIEAVWNPRSGRVRSQRYVVVPEWGHAVVFRESWFSPEVEPGPTRVFTVRTEVALDERTQIWFPSRTHYTAVVDGETTQDEVAEFRIVSLNEPLAESIFTLGGMGVPAGRRVLDAVQPSATDTIWDGDQVVSLSAQLPILSDGGGRYSRWLLIGLAVTALAGALVLWRSAARR